MCKTLCFKKHNSDGAELISAKNSQKFCSPEIKNRLVIPEYTMYNGEYYRISYIGQKAFHKNTLTKILIISNV